MPALPADIRRYTNDGVVVTADDVAIRNAHANAVDALQEEVEMFYADPDVGQMRVDERLASLSTPDPLHEMVEVSDSFGINDIMQASLYVPHFLVVDEERGVSRICRTRAFSLDLEDDREAVEVIE